MAEHWLDTLAKRIAGEKKPDPHAGCTKRSGEYRAWAGPEWDCHKPPPPKRTPIEPDPDLIQIGRRGGLT